MLVLLPTVQAALFADITDSAIGTTGEWSNQVLLDDLDGDGDLDIAFANGGDYASPGPPETNRVFLNTGGAFAAATLPGGPDLCRSIAAGDLDGDGVPELLVSGAYQTASRLFRWDGAAFVQTSGRLPAAVHSIGDVALGDLDGDGDLDAVLADWGPGDPLSNGGAVTRVWRNDAGTLTDITASAMPEVPVPMSWDLELADVDGDFDLDVLVSSKPAPGSFLFLNDGTGTFTDASDRLPPFSNNYAFAPMDIDGDGDLDLATINDGPNLREHILVNDGTGTFTNGNPDWWPISENLGEDDNSVEFADLDDDGDPDFVIGSLSGADRALVNSGSGFSLYAGTVFAGGFTPGTLGVSMGHIDDDGRPDAVMAQGEVASVDRVFRGDEIRPDTQPPVVRPGPFVPGGVLDAHIHDRATPVRPSDIAVELVISQVDAENRFPAFWRGGQLWRVDVPGGIAPDATVSLCATDRPGNTACAVVQGDIPDTDVPGETASDTADDAEGPGDEKRCGCANGPSLAWSLLGLLSRR